MSSMVANGAAILAAIAQKPAEFSFSETQVNDLAMSLLVTKLKDKELNVEQLRTMAVAIGDSDFKLVLEHLPDKDMTALLKAPGCQEPRPERCRCDLDPRSHVGPHSRRRRSQHATGQGEGTGAKHRIEDRQGAAEQGVEAARAQEGAGQEGSRIVRGLTTASNPTMPLVREGRRWFASANAALAEFLVGEPRHGPAALP